MTTTAPAPAPIARGLVTAPEFAAQLGLTVAELFTCRGLPGPASLDGRVLWHERDVAKAVAARLRPPPSARRY